MRLMRFVFLSIVFTPLRVLPRSAAQACGAFYADLSNRAPGLDTSSDQVRQSLPPLNQPDASVGPVLVAAARESSTDAFHLAMGLGAGLLLAGAAVNAVGIKDPERCAVPDPQPETAASSAQE